MVRALQNHWVFACCAQVLDTIKFAEDGSGDVIIRVYEALGGRDTCTLTS